MHVFTVHIHICMYVYMYSTYVCMYVCIYCTYIHMYVCVYVQYLIYECMYVQYVLSMCKYILYISLLFGARQNRVWLYSNFCQKYSNFLSAKGLMHIPLLIGLFTSLFGRLPSIQAQSRVNHKALNPLYALCVRSCIGMSEIAMLTSETCFQVDRQIYQM